MALAAFALKAKAEAAPGSAAGCAAGTAADLAAASSTGDLPSLATGRATDPATSAATRLATNTSPDLPLGPPLDRFLLLRDLVRGTFAFNRTSLAGHFVGALVVELIFADAAPQALRLGWGGAFALVWAARAVLALRFAGNEPTATPALLVRLRVWQAGVLATGALWGAAAWLFYGHGSALHQIGLVLVVYTFCVASVPILAPQLGLFIVFVVLVFGPAIAAVAVQQVGPSWELAIVMAVALAMVMLLARNYRQSFDSNVALKLRTEALAEQLRAAKAVSDAARHAAEVANRAKTQFFTAASHDLRQPLHAMGLFAEALRQRAHEPEVAQLVGSINESVDALEELFSELLDITRIDSGGVAVDAEHFEVGDIFRKLRLHFEPAAFEKGLELRFRGARHAVHADPLLVERVLRNLLSNAIRYTVDGSVLVSARKSGGFVRLQVWDTGRGIGEAEQARVFEEFYQVPGGALAMSATEKKGLGLGLAIVARLAALMGVSVALRSTPGRGSVFALDLPAGKAARSQPPARSASAPLSLTLAGRLIVVVEDEPAVRRGLEMLLRSWGATCLAFADVAAAVAWASSGDAKAAAPALLVVDYRLEPGETGIAAIAAMRSRFGAQLPAIVVTGSSMAGHDEEAVAHDFHLLIKPVLPNKLRAMIAFKLGQDGKTPKPGPS